MQMYVVKSSDVAKLVVKPKEADEVSLKFGKIFEDCYTEALYYYDKSYNTKSIPQKFIRKVAYRLKTEGIYSSELVRKAYRMYSCLLRAGVIGLKPRTEFRKFNDEILIAAQPDVYNIFTDQYFEFKTYPIDDYARMQCKVFSWVLRSPVILIGLVDNNGYIDYQKEVIECKELPVKRIPKELGQLQEVCEKCWKPLRYCNCYSYNYPLRFEDLIDDDFKIW